ncbi:MAG: DNA adenine methylase [Ruthenibacterium sp.]
MGSKNQLALAILARMPHADNFYDLFAGGCAITHAACLSGKFKQVYTNDIEPLPMKLLQDAIDGKHVNENRWISREDFNRLRFEDPYVACCFCFGGDWRSYAYSAENEKLKRALHFAIFFNDFSELESLEIIIPTNLTKSQSASRRYAELRKFFKQKKQHIVLESLGRLGRLQRLGRPKITVGDYRQIKIKPDSVIYCDIPYQNAERYIRQKAFDYDGFFEWCGEQIEPLFISSYELPKDKFTVIAELRHRQLLDGLRNNRKAIIEKVYRPKHQLSQSPVKHFYQQDLFGED